MGVWARPLGVLFSLLCLSPAVADDARPYRAIPAEIGASVVPSDDLVAAAQKLVATAAAHDVAGVVAMMVERPLLVSSGITVGVQRQTAAKGPWGDAASALADIGSYYQEGDIVASGRSIDFTELYVGNTLGVIVQSLVEPDWGRDPLVADAVCTYRGARWKAADGRATGSAESRGFWVERAIPARRSGDPTSAKLATLKPGRIYLEGSLHGLPEEMRGIRLPAGGVGAVEMTALRDATQWGICLRRIAPDDWRIVAFSTALL